MEEEDTIAKIEKKIVEAEAHLSKFDDAAAWVAAMNNLAALREEKNILLRMQGKCCK